MAEDEVVVPSEGNAGLDPARAALKPVLGYLEADEAKSSAAAAAKKESDPYGVQDSLLSKPSREFVSHPKYEKTTPSASSEKPSSAPSKEYPTSKLPEEEKKQRARIVEGLDPPARASRGVRNAAGGAGRSMDASYGYMQFKTPLFRQHVGSSQYKLIVPTHGGYLPQIAGPFRPLTLETQGGFPQCLGPEAMGTGMGINIDAE